MPKWASHTKFLSTKGRCLLQTSMTESCTRAVATVVPSLSLFSARHLMRLTKKAGSRATVVSVSG